MVESAVFVCKCNLFVTFARFNLTKLKMNTRRFLMTAAIVAVLIAGFSMLMACGKDDDKKDDNGYVDLGLQSGTRWRNQNENGFFTYEEAMNQFGGKVPTQEQWTELKLSCEWEWTGNEYKVTGPNGKSITLPAAGSRSCNGATTFIKHGCYWSSTPKDSDDAYYLSCYSVLVSINSDPMCKGYSVRLIQ